jgi:hypothetical protein
MTFFGSGEARFSSSLIIKDLQQRGMAKREKAVISEIQSAKIADMG